MNCRRCGSLSLERVTRRGLLHRIAAPIFGYYPWRCVRCHAVTLLKVRRAAEKDSVEDVETEQKEAA